MPTLLDISKEDGTPIWVNLDLAFVVEEVDIPFQPDDSQSPTTKHVVLYQVPGGTGVLLPERFTLSQVLVKMQGPKSIFARNERVR